MASIMLISENYRHQLAMLHTSGQKFGVMGRHYARGVAKIYDANECKSLLDYGAGRQMLAQGLREMGRDDIAVSAYDPAVPELAASPRPADMVACIDVLEHVEPDCIDDVLRHMHTMARKSVMVTASLIPALKTLPDGRNAHILLRTPCWWLTKLCNLWTVRHVECDDDALLCVGKP
jgi:hypothetical protein